MGWFDMAWTQPDPATLVANGGEGALQYVSRDSSKDLTYARLQSLLAGGLDVGMMFEDRTGNPWGGAGQGAADGLLMRQRMDSFGCPAWMSAIFCIDQATPQGDWPTLDAYATAFMQQQGDRPLGVYSTTQYMQHLVDIGLLPGTQWFAGATSWSGGVISTDAHLIQRVSTPVAGTDWNDVQHHPFGSWLAPMDGDDMPTAAEIADAVWNRASPGSSDGQYIGAPMHIFLADTRRAFDDDGNGMSLFPKVWNHTLSGRFGLPDAAAQIYLVDARVAAGDAANGAAAANAALASQAAQIQLLIDALGGTTPTDPGDSELHATLKAQLDATEQALSDSLASQNSVTNAALAQIAAVGQSLVPPTA